MRHAARSSRPPTLLLRGCRAVLVGSVSLALVLGGSASTATPEDPLAPDEEVTDPDTAGEAPAATDLGEVGTSEPTDAPEADSGEEAVPAPEAATEPTGEEAPAATEPPSLDAPVEAPVEDDGVLDGGIGVLAVGVPPEEPAPDQAKLIVRAGGDRTGTGETSQTVSPLAGVDYQFYYRTSPGITDGDPVGELCTTDATGTCGVIVDLPDADDNYFYAVAVGAPPGWTAPSSWSTGDNYRFETGEITQGGTVADRTVILPTAFNATVSEPTWANVRDNNPLPPQCGLDIAMVLDLSNSVTFENPGVLEIAQGAATDFVDALTGTPSQIALYTFASTAPAAGPTNGPVPLTSVATPASAAPLIDQINGYTATPTLLQGLTNWDRGLHQVAESTDTYDVVMFFTDGAPTWHRNVQGAPEGPTIQEVNEAIHSANAVKALPNAPALIAIGMGPQASTDAAENRLSLISGPDEGVDFFRTEFEDLAALLADLADENCAGTLTVVKEIETEDGGTVPGGPGWTFTTDTELVTPASATTDDSSAVNFTVGYPDGVLSRPVTVVETQQDGFELVEVDGANAVCVDTEGTPLPVTNSGDLGFTVDVDVDDIVSCTVRNVPVPPEYDDLTVTKTAATSFARDWDWDILKVAEEDYLEVPAGEDGTFGYDVTVTPEGPVDSGFQVDGTITVSNPNDIPFTGVSVLDSMSSPPGGSCSVPDGTDLTVPAGGTVTLPYTCTPAGATATTDGTNSVTVTWDSAAYPGTTGVATATAPFDFAEAEIDETDRYVTVTDSELDLSTLPGGNAFDAVDGEQTLTYDLTWPATPGQCVEHLNVATVANTPGTDAAPGIFAVNQTSTEIVTLCAGLDLEVEKNVVLSFARTYLWEIDKVADATLVTPDPATGTASVDYTVTATPTGSSDGDWAMQGVVTVTNPNAWLDITADVTDTVDVGGGAVCAVADGTGVLVAAGDTVDLTYTCTFTGQPSYAGTNTATATWDDTAPTPGSSAVGTAEITPDDWSQTPVNETITVLDDQTDPANPVELGTATWNAEGTPTVLTYTLELDGVPDSCVDYTNTAWIAQTQQSAEATVEVCSPDLEVEKRAVAADQQADGSWLVRYEIDVTNPDDYLGAYSLSDTILFGGDITPTAAAWFPEGDPTGGGMWTGLPAERTAVLATDVPIEPGATHSYVVVVTADVGEGVVGTPAGQCDGYEETGGFLNEVTLTVLGEDETDDACNEPVAPTIDKSAGELVANEDGTWTVTYTIDVDNPDTGQTVAYDLSDELDLAGDVVVVDASVERDGTDYPAWDGVTTTEIATGVLLAPDTTHTYEVTVVVDLSGVTGGDAVRACGEGEQEGQGLLNVAVIVSGNDEYDDDACVPIPDPVITVDKTAVSATLQADGDWQVVYTVVADNASDVGGVYDLTDTLEFGEGITPLTASWTLEGTDVVGEWTDLPTEVTTTLAVDRPLVGGESHTYVVTVVADVAEGVAGTPAGRCSGEDGTDGGGFLNAATLTAHGNESTDRACLPPGGELPDEPAWTLEKSSDPVSGSRVRPGDTIEYTITATPTGGADPVGLVVRDDLTRVLDNARGTGAIEVSTGSFAWDGDVIVWEIPQLSEPETLTFAVVVDSDAWNVTLHNVVTGEGSPPPVCLTCETTHTTPPRVPGLPTTGADVTGAALLAVLLSFGGLALATTRRRKES